MGVAPVEVFPVVDTGGSALLASHLVAAPPGESGRSEDEGCKEQIDNKSFHYQLPLRASAFSSVGLPAPLPATAPKLPLPHEEEL